MSVSRAREVCPGDLRSWGPGGPGPTEISTPRRRKNRVVVASQISGERTCTRTIGDQNVVSRFSPSPTPAGPPWSFRELSDDRVLAVCRHMRRSPSRSSSSCHDAEKNGRWWDRPSSLSVGDRTPTGRWWWSRRQRPCGSARSPAAVGDPLVVPRVPVVVDRDGSLSSSSVANADEATRERGLCSRPRRVLAIAKSLCLLILGTGARLGRPNCLATPDLKRGLSAIAGCTRRPTLPLGLLLGLLP